MRERQLYTVASEGVTIKYAGGIKGPLTTPTELPLDSVVTMVRKGYEIYQHNPVNLKEKVLVTKENVGHVTFTTTKAQTVSQRILNRQIQEMEKPMITNVTRKEDDKKYDKSKKYEKNNNNNNNSSSTTTDTKTTDDVSTPDSFTKN